MDLYNVYRNGEFIICCHAGDEWEAIICAMSRKGFPPYDGFDNEWSAERN